MANVIVFGKPRAFESYEYIFDGNNASVENTHREPIIKPRQYQEPILHYYATGSYTGVEYYTRAKGFESEREGIVFGISVKFSTDFNIYDTISEIIQSYWGDFVRVLLDDTDKFLEDNITNRLKTAKWSQSDIDKIQSTSLTNPIPVPSKGILLLVAPCLEDVKSVESLIKEYEDVYIASNPNVFKEPNNETVLKKEAGNQIFIIHEEQIIPFVEETPPKPELDHSESVLGRIAKLPIWGKKTESNPGTEESDGGTTDFVTKLRKIVAIICAIVAPVVLIIAFIWYSQNNKDLDTQQPDEGQGANTEQKTEESAVDYSGISVEMTPCRKSITSSWTLKPQIRPKNCTKCYLSDLTFVVSDQSLVRINQEYKLIVKECPPEDTKIKVKALINDTLVLGEQEYTIAKKSGENQYNYVIPKFRGKPRTIGQWITDLDNALTDGSYTKQKVIEICDSIINSSNYHNNERAKKLKKKAEQTEESQL